MGQPLKGIRVVSLEQAAAAPLCARRLALAGAEVFKVERPEGDFARQYDAAVHGQSSYFVWLNAGKKSVVLDLSSERDRSRLMCLIDVSDVLLHNLKPGALARLGVDLQVLHQRRPEFISLSISGFAPDGPGAHRKAYDLLMQAESGLADITGSAQEPGRVGVSIVDAATGMYSYEAILEALLERMRTGQGAQLHVALFDAVADLLSVPYLLERYADQAPARVGLAHPGICPYGVFTSADGQRFILSIQNEREWQRLCRIALKAEDLLADPRCADNPTRVQHRAYVDDAVQTRFGALSYAALSTLMDQADLAFAPVNGIAALKHHADFHTMVVRLGGEEVLLPRVPGHAPADGLRVPDLGEHNAELDALLDGIDKDSGSVRD